MVLWGEIISKVSFCFIVMSFSSFAEGNGTTKNKHAEQNRDLSEPDDFLKRFSVSSHREHL
jgi:hypothetical protein